MYVKRNSVSEYLGNHYFTANALIFAVDVKPMKAGITSQEQSSQSDTRRREHTKNEAGAEERPLHPAHFGTLGVCGSYESPPGQQECAKQPKRESALRVPLLVEKNSQWIERAFQKAKAFQELIGPAPVWQMPEEITSLALDLTWRVLTLRADMKSVVVRETSGTTLVLHGATDDAAACQTALKGWLTHKAEDHLIPWLKGVSDETGLSYSAASIRQQQTRWGSCSSRRLISLNARLLFLPPDLVTYVLVHELCHTKHLNHSPRFWRLVESYLPDCRRFDRQLRSGGRCMPGWLTASCVGKAGKLGRQQS
jgi:predicted metal-dependent hydrolase